MIFVGKTEKSKKAHSAVILKLVLYRLAIIPDQKSQTDTPFCILLHICRGNQDILL